MPGTHTACVAARLSWRPTRLPKLGGELRTRTGGTTGGTRAPTRPGFSFFYPFSLSSHGAWHFVGWPVLT
eukprot:3824964-Rhodomonas_salina.4